jgi:hypothetical protein
MPWICWLGREKGWEWGGEGREDEEEMRCQGGVMVAASGRPSKLPFRLEKGNVEGGELVEQPFWERRHYRKSRNFRRPEADESNSMKNKYLPAPTKFMYFSWASTGWRKVPFSEIIKKKNAA